ncbi:MAG: hypothetical protein D6730_02815 [Bacteroidetes bacterium]|nr:MAG: hypothetical protein D6730_02815 [Bacteroidota bacterium]
MTILLKKAASCFRKVSKRLLTSVNTEIRCLLEKCLRLSRTHVRIDKVYPGEAIVTFDGKACKAMCDPLTTVSDKRFINLGGKISSSDMQLIEEAVKIQLGLG